VTLESRLNFNLERGGLAHRSTYLKMQQREYQQRAIDFLCSVRRGICKAPAGSGKTHIAASALSRCLDGRKERANVEIMVNTREQVEQMQTACDRFDIASKCDLQIYCAAGAPIGTKPDMIIVDECHRSSSASWSAKIKSCDGGRWGLSATPFDDKEAEQVAIIKELFGERIHTIERAELVENGHLSKARVIWRDVPEESKCLRFIIDTIGESDGVARFKKMSFKVRDIKSKDSMSDEDKRKEIEEIERKCRNDCVYAAAQKIGIWANQWRDYAIISEANRRVSDGHHVIVLIGKIEHGERLIAAIPGAVLCFSGMGAKRRREALASFRSGSIRCLVASSMLDEGFDAPIADCLILASAGKSQRKAIQSTGRVLRPYIGQESGIIVDFTDRFHPMLARQAGKRRAIYRGLNYEQ